MPLKAPIEVRSVKADKITVHKLHFGDVATADFVGQNPRTFHVMGETVKGFVIESGTVDMRVINNNRHGVKEPKRDDTSVESENATL